MEKTLLWEAFSTLSRPERRLFDKWVASPFYNHKESLCLLCRYLRRCVDQGQVPSSETAFATVFPDSRYDDTKMRLLNSELLSLLEQFWVSQKLRADTLRQQLDLAAEYRRRNLVKHAGITLRECRNALQKSPHRDAQYLQRQHELEFEQFQTASAAKRYEDFNLQEMCDWIDAGFAAQKLQHICLSLAHQTVYKKQYDFGLFEPLMAFVRNKGLLNTPAIALYYYAVRFLSDSQAEDDFTCFRSLLSAKALLFPADELRTLYLLAINFGVKKSNEAGQSWFRQTFELYQEALSLGLLLENKQLSRFAYNNIVIVALRIGETDWAEQFIHQYRPMLEKQHREAAFSLNAARVAYGKKDYRSALLLLQNADYKDLINSLNAKVLMLKIYYETDEFEALESHLSSTRNYIRRHTALGYHRDNYSAIVQFTRQLLNPDSQQLQQLRQEILAAPVLTEREWLLDQLSHLLIERKDQ